MNLDEEEELLLRRARSEFTPSREQAGRVRAAVLGAAALPGALVLGKAAKGAAEALAASTAPAAATAKSIAVAQLFTSSTLKVLALGTFVSAGVATGLYGALQRKPQAPPSSATVEVRPPEPTRDDADGGAQLEDRVLGDGPEATSVPDTASPDRKEPAAARARAQVPPPPPNVDGPSPPRVEEQEVAAEAARQRTLREELQSIQEAERALHAGRPARALELLRATQGESHAQLHEERSAVRSIALCELGTSGGRSEAQRFLEAYPGSLYAARVRSACGQ
jgi:hypothetical protein